MTNFSQYFKRKHRDEVTEFTYLSDNRPQALTDLVRAIHISFDCLPNDWIYSIVSLAFNELEQDPSYRDNIEADPYYSQLYKWFGEPFAHVLCLEYTEDIGCEEKDVYAIISGAQWLAKDRIYGIVLDFINEQKEVTNEA